MTTSLAWKTVTTVIFTTLFEDSTVQHENKQSLRMLREQMASVVDPDSLKPDPDPALKANLDPARNLNTDPARDPNTDPYRDPGF
jgi:hypothetical protein